MKAPSVKTVRCAIYTRVSSEHGLDQEFNSLDAQYRFRWACECTDKSVPLGKYCLSRPLVFSFEPRCHGLCGSQK